MMNYTRICIFAVGNEMESLLSVKPNLLWVENNAWLQRGTSSLYKILLISGLPIMPLTLIRE